MMAFLHWIRDVVVGMLNGVVKFALFVIALFLVIAAIGAVQGDGLPANMVLGLDLRSPMKDSAAASPLNIGGHPLTVMDVVLGLDAAGRDARVKGVYLRVGSADISVAQAEEIGQALKRFRATGKFVIAHSSGFVSTGIGDYLTAANADQIWMQPKSPFSAAGSGAGAIFLRGLFDKIQAEPQMVKRSDYKSFADMYMEKDYTAPDREQITALLTSFYNDGTAAVAADRKVDQKAVQAAFDASPQSAENAMRAGLIDKTGYDDDALAAALARAGDGAKAENFSTFARTADERERLDRGGNIALIEASGDIVDGTAGGGMFGGSTDIASDDLSRAIRAATKDSTVKAILLRVDSPGGSVTASDQILDAVKKAEAAGKPVVISMGSVAASGGYYISCAAAKIVAEPATITGSIGVVTGKISFGKSLALIGVTADQIGVGTACRRQRAGRRNLCRLHAESGSRPSHPADAGADHRQGPGVERNGRTCARAGGRSGRLLDRRGRRGQAGRRSGGWAHFVPPLSAKAGLLRGVGRDVRCVFGHSSRHAGDGDAVQLTGRASAGEHGEHRPAQRRGNAGDQFAGELARLLKS
jgi:protease-4